MKALVLAFLLLTATQAHATSQTFNVFFPITQTVTAQGTYTVTNGLVSAFDAVIGSSTFHGGAGPDPFDNVASVFFNGDGVYSGSSNPLDFSTLTMTEWLFSDPPGFPNPPHWVHEYRVHTPGGFDPSGFYTAVLVSSTTPELSSIWLVLVGALLIGGGAYLRRQS